MATPRPKLDLKYREIDGSFFCLRQLDQLSIQNPRMQQPETEVISIWLHFLGIYFCEIEVNLFSSSFSHLGQLCNQACCLQGCRGCHGTPRFWQISQPYLNRLCPQHYHWYSWIFRPSYVPALNSMNWMTMTWFFNFFLFFCTQQNCWSYLYFNLFYLVMTYRNTQLINNVQAG